MTSDMTWDAIVANEGSEIEAISATEVDEVSGGIPAIVYLAAGIAVGLVVTYVTRK